MPRTRFPETLRAVTLASFAALAGCATDKSPPPVPPKPLSAEQILRENKVPFKVEADVGRNNVASALLSLLPIVLIVAFVFFMMRQMQGGGTRGAMSFGKSRARLLTEKHGRVTFDDVAGVDEAKEELQ